MILLNVKVDSFYNDVKVNLLVYSQVLYCHKWKLVYYVQRPELGCIWLVSNAPHIHVVSYVYCRLAEFLQRYCMEIPQVRIVLLIINAQNYISVHIIEYNRIVIIFKPNNFIES